jgi:hypothetical protein
MQLSDYIVEMLSYAQVLAEYLTGGFCGFDLDGSPVRVERYGCLDMKGLMCSSKKSDLEKTKLLQCEYIVKQWEEQSKLVREPSYVAMNTSLICISDTCT